MNEQIPVKNQEATKQLETRQHSLSPPNQHKERSPHVLSVPSHRVQNIQRKFSSNSNQSAAQQINGSTTTTGSTKHYNKQNSGNKKHRDKNGMEMRSQNQ